MALFIRFSRVVFTHASQTRCRYARTLIAVLALLIIAGCDSNSSTDLVPEIPAVWKTAVDGGFTGSALVRLGDETLLNAAAGFADREQAIPNGEDTVFDMGSLTKQITGALVLALQEDGLLRVEDPLSRYFNALPADKADITLHQLLTHTAGLPEAVGHDYEAITQQDYLERVWSVALIAPPGAGYAYSNVGYSVLAAIVEQVSGASYDSVLQTRLLQGAGIEVIGYTEPDWSQQIIARGYLDPDIADELGQPADISALELPWAEDGPYWNLRGNGGLLTRAEDLLTWHHALASEQVLNAQSLDAYYARHIDEGDGDTFYGYGWVTEDTPIGPLRYHGGGNGYYYAQMLSFPEKDLVIITLANEHNAASEDLAWALARSAVPELQDWHSALSD